MVDAASAESNGGYGADVLNNSWGGGEYSETLRSAVNAAARLGAVVVAAKGNNGHAQPNYPSDYDPSWMLSVGGTQRNGSLYWNSNTGNGIDVVAPAVSVYSTVPTARGSYDYKTGTSMATPHVAGLAALLISEGRDRGFDLHPNDVEGLIRASAEETSADNTPGYDDEFGAGRINAAKALALLDAPYVLERSYETGGSVVASTGTYTLNLRSSFTGSSGVYLAKRHTVEKTITFYNDYASDASAWCRGTNETIGWSPANPNYQTGFCEVLSNTGSTARVRTYVYQIWTLGGTYWGYYPTTPQNVRFEYSVVGEPAPLSASISGPSSVARNTSATWRANVHGGSSPFSYAWTWNYQCSGGPLDPRLPYKEPCPAGTNSGGTSSSMTKSFSASWPVSIRLNVTDATGDEVFSYKTVQVGGGARVASAESASGEALPEAVTLGAAYPNPFAAATTVRFGLPAAAEARLVVYDALGREVARLAEGAHDAGWHEVAFDGADLSSGVYVARLEAGGRVETRRLTLLK